MPLEDNYFLVLIQKYLDKSISSTEKEELYNLMIKEESRLDLYLFLNSKKTSLKRNDHAIESLFENSKQKYKLSEIVPSQINEKSPSSSKIKYIRSLAAVALLIAATVSVTYIYRHIPTPNIIRLATAKGERKLFRLIDGTEIWLNSDSQLSYNDEYGYSNRDVKLSGEAYFKVSKNKKLPFHVNSYGNTVEVLGTQFNVQAYPEEQKMETSLFEGKVNLKINNRGSIREFIMRPGEKIEVINIRTNAMQIKKSNILKDPTDNQAVDIKHISTKNGEQLDALWTKNKLVFQDDPVDMMVRKMQRWYNKTIIVENKDILNQSYTGVFQEKIAQEVLDILIKTGVNLNYRVQRDTIILY